MPDLAHTSSATAWVTEEWMTQLASAVEMMTEVRPGVKLGGSLAGVAEAPAEALWYSIPLTFAAHAAIFVGAVEDTWFQMGQSALLAAGLQDITPEDARGTYLEIVTQASSSLAAAIAVKLDRSVSSLPAKEVKPAEEGLAHAASLGLIEFSLAEAPPRTLYLAWSVELEAALTDSKPAAAEAVKEAPRLEKSKTLDLLMEVELPVSVSFGRAQLPLRDVLKLNSGSIVELNRTITDPVEIIVNNCVIARGEVVVVEGNYGVRIHEVISREERLRTLK